MRPLRRVTHGHFTNTNAPFVTCDIRSDSNGTVVDDENFRFTCLKAFFCLLKDLYMVLMFTVLLGNQGS